MLFLYEAKIGGPRLLTDHHDAAAMLAARHQNFNGKHLSALITAHSADSATPEIAAERRDRAHMNLLRNAAIVHT